MSHETAPPDRWLHFDLHGRLGIRVERDAPAAAQLRTMLACFASGEVPADIVVSREFEDVGVTTQLEDELSYSPDERGVVQDGSRSCGTGTRSASTATASCSPRSCRSWTGRWSSAAPA